MARLNAHFFGSFEVSLDGEAVSGFDSDKVRALLAYLAVEADRPHRREKLAGLLWPDFPENSARTNLRRALSNLRQVIGDRQADPPFFFISRQTIQFNKQSEAWVDVIHFLDAVNSQSPAAETLAEATDLYRGAFLEGLSLPDSAPFEDWQRLTRESLQQQALRAWRRVASLYEGQEQYELAIRFAQQQVKLEPTREDANRQLMRLLALSGRRSEALAVYESCRRLLVEELGMDPAKRTTELYEQILAGELSFNTPTPKGIHGYELEDEIGQGAYGTIHRAVQPSVSREVAVKVIRRRYANDPEFIRRFEAEAQTIARLEHPHIVPLYDYWRDPNGAYLVMRYLRGGSLSSALEQGPWGLGPAGKLLDQIAGALAVAHRQGVVHRDIKPANILFDEIGNAYLTDFGIAKNLTGEAQMTVEGAVIGTPDYISPEQILNEPVTPQSDIYSLGAVVYETLTGEKPFPDSSVANLIYKHLHEPLPLVSTSRPDLPPQIDMVIQRATAKHPVERYSGVLEMAEAFRAVVIGSTTDKAFFDISDQSEIVELYNPYKGLRAFQEADAADFFGRDALVEQLLVQLSPDPDGRSGNGQGSRFLAVVGPSGSGKSSVVKAGLIPALRDGALPGSEKWFMAEMVPGTHPLEELELALWSIAVDPPPSLVEPMARDTRGMLRTIRRILPHESPQGGTAQLLLVIDQFEELFTLANEERRDFFIESLLAALLSPHSPLWVVVTLRADFFDRPLHYESLGRLVKENSVIVLPLTAGELAFAVSEPARRVSVSLERGLESAIIADVVDQPGALPLMQYALTELFENRQGSDQDGTMTRSAYVEIGGVSGALSRRAEEIFDHLDPAEQEAARQLFLRLVTLGEGVEDTRRRVLRNEIEAIQMSGDLESSEVAQTSGVSKTPDVSPVVDAYGAARLLTFDHDPMTRQPTVEVAHEALLREWARLRRWLDESRDDIRQERVLSRAAGEWNRHDRDESFLLRGTRLDQAAEWRATSGLIQTPLVQAFISQSLLQREQRRRAEEERVAREARLERTRRTLARGLIVVLSIGLVVALALTYFAFTQRNDAEQSAAFARTEADARATAEMAALGEAAARATAQAEAEGEAQARATAQAEAEGETQARATAQAEAETQRHSALDSAAEAQNVALVAGSQAALANHDTDTALALAWQAVALNPDSALAQAQLSEVAYAPGTVRILSGNKDIVNRIVLSPDDKTLLGGVDDGSVILWDTETGRILWQQQVKIQTDPPWVQDVAFSPDGQFVAATYDDRIMFWYAADGQLFRQIESLVNRQKITFNPTGDQFATIGSEENSRLVLWDFATGEVIGEYQHGSNIEDIVYTADGSAILIASKEGAITLIDAQTGQVLNEFQEYTGPSGVLLRNIALSPDGTQVIASAVNAGLLVWDFSTGELLHNYIYDGVLAVAFHPFEGKVLIGDLLLLHTIDLQTGAILHVNRGHNRGILSIAIASDGSRAYTASVDETIRVWDLNSGQMVRRLTESSSPLGEVALSPDGQNVLVGSTDGTATLWDLETGEEIRRFVDDQPINTVAFSPDGRMALIGTGYENVEEIVSGHIILWDVETGSEIRRFEGQPYAVTAVAFSPDGRTAVSAGHGAMAILWDVETGAEIRRFEDYWVDSPWAIEAYLDVDFSPDGKRIYASHDDGNIIGWEVESGQIIQQLVGHQTGALGISFSNDGQRLASGGMDAQVILWNVQTGTPQNHFIQAGAMEQPQFSPDEALLLGGNINGFTSLLQVDTGEVIRRYVGFAESLSFSPDGFHAVIGFLSGAVELWRIDSTLDDLLTWTQNNRYIPELTCEQRALYGVEPLCETGG